MQLKVKPMNLKLCTRVLLLIAKSEKSKDAVKSFTWALDTEKKHQVFYKTALAALSAGGEKAFRQNGLFVLFAETLMMQEA